MKTRRVRAKKKQWPPKTPADYEKLVTGARGEPLRLLQNFKLPQDVIHALDTASKKERVTKTSIVEKALRRYLKEYL